MAHQNLAVVYGIEKKYDKAIHKYKEILRVSPGNVEGYFGLANFYMVTGDFENALENAKKAVKIYEKTNSHHIGDGCHLIGLIQYYKGDKKLVKKYLKLAKDKGSKIHPQLEEEFFNKN